MRYPHDKEFPELTAKQADFFRAWEKKRAEKGGDEPTYGEIEGYGYTNACAYITVLRRKGFLDKQVRNFRKSDAEFPDIGERSANVLRFIKKYTAENGVPPALREIQGSSYPGVNYGALESVGRLVDAGYLTKHPKISRGIRLTDKAFRPTQKTVEALAPSGPPPPEVQHFADIIGITPDSPPEVGLHASVGDVELTVHTRTGTVVLRRKDGTRLALELPPGDPIHRKAAFADLLWILQGAAATP